MPHLKIDDPRWSLPLGNGSGRDLVGVIEFSKYGETIVNYGLKIEHLAGYQPTRAHIDQYVAGEVRPDGSVRFLYSIAPPATGPVGSRNLGSLNTFIVFSSQPRAGGCDLSDLAEVWRHSSQHHESVLRLYSLRDLGIEES